MKHVTPEVPETSSMCHQKYQVHEACGTRSNRYMKRVAPEVSGTWSIWHKKYEVHKACDTRSVRYMELVTPEVLDQRQVTTIKL